MKGNCVSCKAKREIIGAKKVKLKNGRYTMKDKCKLCGIKIFRFVKNKVKIYLFYFFHFSLK
jgi:rRNA maturation protein Nop10